MKAEQRVRLTIAYDGTDFEGWQIQKQGRTVQDELEKALAKMHKHLVRVVGSGRTDSGVHARGQVVHFDTSLRIDASRFTPALNRLLPGDIRVLQSLQTTSVFHARFDARQRTYHYRISQQPNLYPGQRRYTLYRKDKLDIPRLNAMSAVLMGTHDFSAFTAAGDSSPNHIRRIDTAVFYEQKELVIFRIQANAFLWKMVRSLLGTLLECCEAGNTPSDFKEILDSLDRGRAGVTAPAHGLTLEKVIYDKEY